MKFLTRLVAGQSIISWILQLMLIYLAWMVSDHKINNNLSTIFGAAILLILTYASLSHDSKSRSK